ncbi:leucine-rich repeat-containing protein 74B-like [Battus philenor]|uniref:leucine-rich repeat-containing protein 74B-like n=1 Tax=Battus philenor TaxID=42288 RepID=UPI0035CEA28D
MSSTEASEITSVNMKVEVIFEKDIESSEEPPMEEWSSLLLQRPEENVKIINYRQGLYDPGSGEICTKYIPMSASSVIRHVYYNYPAVPDPGVKEALFDPEPKVIYPDDGQELYLALCKEAETYPISSFHRQLLENKVNLRYYGVTQAAFRIIAMSLKLNKYVTILDLTDNWIGEDGCFHLGQMLAENCTLKVLILYGCRIGPGGAKRLLHNLAQNRALRELNLSRNQLKDEGVRYLAKAITQGADVCKIDLSYNDLADLSVTYIVDALEINKKLTHLNMSWNFLKSANAVFYLCCVLASNKSFLDLDLSWNALGGLRVGKSIGILLRNHNVHTINLSSNKMTAKAIKPIAKALEKDTHLNTLIMSANPMSPEDAYKLLLPMLKPTVKLEKLILDNVMVKSNFVKLREEILSLDFRKNAEIVYGGVYAEPVRQIINMRDLVLNRIDYIGKTKFKNRQLDIALMVMSLYKMDKEPMDTKPFIKALRVMGLTLPEELADQLTTLFAGPPKPKSTTVNLAAMVDYFKRKWPDRQLPPTPPPEPEPDKKKKHPKKRK